ncbi:MAG: hypothetical protein CMJ23_05385, partial [Phycisphaerae bacterium]|nr:hypothetical protein [Phycisphaerae bacterium]
MSPAARKVRVEPLIPVTLRRRGGIHQEDRMMITVRAIGAAAFGICCGFAVADDGEAAGSNQATVVIRADTPATTYDPMIYG